MHYCAPVNLEKCKNNHCIQKVSICCIVETFGIVGPFFFDNDNGESITVIAEHCVAMLQNFLLPHLEAIGADPKNLYFQQNGATVRTTRRSINTVCNLFHKVIIGFRDIPRLASSLDIMILDFLLWGYLNERVYRTDNHTAQEMKHAIQYKTAQEMERAIQYETAQEMERAIQYETAQEMERAVQYETAQEMERAIQYETAQEMERAIQYETAQEMERAIQYEIALINQDHNLLH